MKQISPTLMTRPEKSNNYKPPIKKNNNFPFVVEKAILKCDLIEHLNKPMIKPTNI